MMPSQGNILFSVLPPSPSVFSEVSVIFWYSLCEDERWLVLHVKAERQQSYYWGSVHGHFLKKTSWEIFFLLFFFLFSCIGGNAMNGEIAWYLAYTGVLIWIKKSTSADRFLHMPRALWWSLQILNFHFLSFSQKYMAICKAYFVCVCVFLRGRFANVVVTFSFHYFPTHFHQFCLLKMILFCCPVMFTWKINLAWEVPYLLCRQWKLLLCR